MSATGVGASRPLPSWKRIAWWAHCYAQMAAGWVPALCGLALFALSIPAKSHGLIPQFGEYDEGILLTNANNILRGDVPYRDFYSNYPPGIFLTLALLWRVFGVSPWVYRLLAVAIQFGMALLAGRIAGRIARVRFSWLAFGLVSAWTVGLGLCPYAWTLGLCLALLFVVLLLRACDAPTRASFVAAGVAYGLVGCARHELFVYLSLVLVPLLLLPTRVFPHFSAFARSPQRLGWLALGIASPLIVVWVPTFLRAGIGPTVRDLFFEQVRYVMPGRVFPLPRLTDRVGEHKLPIFMMVDFQAAVALTLAAPALAVLMYFADRRRGKERLGIALLGALAVAVIPQMMGRTDLPHALFTITPGLALAAALGETVVRAVDSVLLKATLALGTAALLTNPTWNHVWPMAPLNEHPMHGDRDRASTRPGFYYYSSEQAAERAAVLDFVRTKTLRNERVFFGNAEHERVVINEVDLYFYADRKQGVRYGQFDPNVVTRREVQEEMIDSLQKHHVRVVVLSSANNWSEAQPPVVPPSSLLDTWLRANFTTAMQRGRYTVLVRDL